MKDIKIIDLNKYGVDDAIELRQPSFRRSLEVENKVAALTVRVNGKDAEADNSNLMNVMMLRDLAFIYKAPFKPTIEEFATFTDKLDDVEYGNGMKFYHEFKEAVEAVKKGEYSPSQDSLEAENVSSE